MIAAGSKDTAILLLLLEVRAPRCHVLQGWGQGGVPTVYFEYAD